MECFDGIVVLEVWGDVKSGGVAGRGGVDCFWRGRERWRKRDGGKIGSLRKEDWEVEWLFRSLEVSEALFLKHLMIE